MYLKVICGTSFLVSPASKEIKPRSSASASPGSEKAVPSPGKYPPVPGIPGAEIFKVETDKAEVVAIQAEADAVIVVVKNRMAVEREGGLLGDIRLVMQILDAAEGAGVEPLLLLRAGRVTLRQQRAGAKLDPIAVSVGAAFVNLLRRERVAGPRLRAQEPASDRPATYRPKSVFRRAARNFLDWRDWFFIAGGG